MSAAAPVRFSAPPVRETRMWVSGVVDPGDRRGRQLGFPTANLAISAHSIAPPDGVYAGWAYLLSGIRPAAISVGRRPTFYVDNGLLLLEAHLLDFDGDLYGQPLTVELARYVRAQVRFASVEALSAQLREDVARCRQLLAELRPSGG